MKKIKRINYRLETSKCKLKKDNDSNLLEYNKNINEINDFFDRLDFEKISKLDDKYDIDYILISFHKLYYNLFFRKSLMLFDDILKQESINNRIMDFLLYEKRYYEDKIKFMENFYKKYVKILNDKGILK